MYDTIRKEAFSLGFKEVFFLPPARLELWQAQAEKAGVGSGLYANLSAAYPAASCFLLLVYPYAPFSSDERISAYYLASQSGYLAARELAGAIVEQGCYCEMASIPARAFALWNGIGTAGRNGLLRLPGFGTRIAIYTLATDACAPRHPGKWEARPCPEGCTACAHACPMGAIGPEGLQVTRCMRYHMNGAEYPEAVYAAQRTHMGCEICQHACPENAALVPGSPSEAVREAFDLPRLIAGDTVAARALVGRNKTTGGKLTAEAVRFAARQGLHADAIRRAGEETCFPAVKHAAEWAASHDFMKK